MKLHPNVLLIVVMSASGVIYAQTPASDAPAPESAPAPAKRPMLKYTAPKSASAGGERIDGDGGSRGVAGNTPAIYVLVPSGAALTTKKQPSLFYFQGGKAGEQHSLSLAVVEANRPKPLVKAVAEKSESGIRRIQLARYGVELQPGVSYNWRVALGASEEGKSLDVFASGALEYVEPSAELTQALAAEPNRKAQVYAEHGIWYDALEEISNQILQSPNNAELLALRASLLEQAGLGKLNVTGIK